MSSPALLRAQPHTLPRAGALGIMKLCTLPLVLAFLASLCLGCASAVAPPVLPCAAPVSVYRGPIEVSRVCPGAALSSEVYTLRAKTSDRVSIGYPGNDPLTHIRSPFLR